MTPFEGGGHTNYYELLKDIEKIYLWEAQSPCALLAVISKGVSEQIGRDAYGGMVARKLSGLTRRTAQVEKQILTRRNYIYVHGRGGRRKTRAGLSQYTSLGPIYDGTEGLHLVLEHCVDGTRKVK